VRGARSVRISRKRAFVLSACAYIVFWLLAFVYWLTPLVKVPMFAIVLDTSYVNNALGLFQVAQILLFLTVGFLAMFASTAFVILELCRFLEPHVLLALLKLGKHVRTTFKRCV
jgi:hypothetical protein